MTDAELRQLAEIERQLVAESPELRRLFDDAAAKRSRRRRWVRLWAGRWVRRSALWSALWSGWRWAGAVTLLVSVALLVAGLVVGLPGLAVTALCPPISFGILLLGFVLLRRRSLRSPRGRRR